ncbi:MAG: hypothetical protein OIN83_12120 [Candidatus Methanoperedens sp.]|nr:hypothetical protein [Candidatus Methanoperedens sp.]
MTARREPCLSERSVSGMSEGCGDWSVRITEQSHIGGAELVIVNNQFFSLGASRLFCACFLRSL